MSSKGKPDPEIYLTAAARIGVRPEEMLVLEDSEAGTRAAHAAGGAYYLDPARVQRRPGLFRRPRHRPELDRSGDPRSAGGTAGGLSAKPRAGSVIAGDDRWFGFRNSGFGFSACITTRKSTAFACTWATPTRRRASGSGSAKSLKQLLACWLVVDEHDLPLRRGSSARRASARRRWPWPAARVRKQELYIYQCTADTRPEDLLVTPVLAESGKIEYHASPLVTAMLRGGVCMLDEGNRMNEKSWASLAPLLDHRRYVESIVAGITIHAHADFRCAVTMNDDESTFEIPDYILSAACSRR